MRCRIAVYDSSNQPSGQGSNFQLYSYHTLRINAFKMPEQLFNDRKFRVPFPVVYARNTDFGKRMKRTEASQGLVSDSGLRKSLKIMSKVFFFCQLIETLTVKLVTKLCRGLYDRHILKMSPTSVTNM